MPNSPKEMKTFKNAYEGVELGLMSETTNIKFMEGPLRFEIQPHPKYKAAIEVCRGNGKQLTSNLFTK